MVLFGVLTIVAALAPVVVSRYRLTEHQVWVLSSVVVLVDWLIFIVVQARTPEYRANVSAAREMGRRRSAPALDLVTTGSYMLSVVLAPLVILLGVVPALEAPLCFTCVVLIPLGGASLLISLVYSQRSPASA